MLKSRKYIAVFLVIFVLIAISAFIYCFILSKDAPLPRDYAQIKEEGVLRVVTSYDPVGYYVDKDTVSGFNHDLISLLQTYTDIKIEVYLESSLDESIALLRDEKYDLIARNIPVTTRLKDSLNMTEPVALNKFVLIQRSKDYNEGQEPIRSHLDLAGKTLHIHKNSPAILRIENLAREIGDSIHYVEDSLYESEQLAMMVAAGDIDFSVLDGRVAEKLAKSLPEIDYATSLDFTHFEAWAVRNHSPVLLDSLNNWIRQMKETDAYKAIYKKYYE